MIAFCCYLYTIGKAQCTILLVKLGMTVYLAAEGSRTCRCVLENRLCSTDCRGLHLCIQHYTTQCVELLYCWHIPNQNNMHTLVTGAASSPQGICELCGNILSLPDVPCNGVNNKYMRQDFLMFHQGLVLIFLRKRKR